MENCRQVNGVDRVVTIENPPETNHALAGSAYYLPVVVKWISRPGVEYADFNNCIYADPASGEQPYRKPQRFVGKLPGLSKLTARCRCDPKFVHVVDWLKEGAPLGADMGIARTNRPGRRRKQRCKHGKRSKTTAPSRRTPWTRRRKLKGSWTSGYVKKISEVQATNYFSGAVVSKLGLLIKPKADGSVKRRDGGGPQSSRATTADKLRLPGLLSWVIRKSSP